MLFSVVIPAFNASSTLARAVESVLAQTWENLELIVIDDGSSDDTAAVASRYVSHGATTRRCVRIVSQECRGAAAARNRGIAEARGDAIAFLDADDYWQPEYLSRVAQVFEGSPHIEVVYVNAVQLHSGKLRTPLAGVSVAPQAIDDFFHEVVHKSFQPATSGVVIALAALGRGGSMREDPSRTEDAEYWARLAVLGAPAVFIPETLATIDDTRLDSLTRGTAGPPSPPSPELWARDIWPLLNAAFEPGFRSLYFRRVRRYCAGRLQAGHHREAKDAARDASARRPGARLRLLLLFIAWAPPRVTWPLWRLGSWAKHL